MKTTTAVLKQVSPYLLEKLKAHPDFAEVFLFAKYLPESPFWQELKIEPDDFVNMKWFYEFSNLATETLERLKREKPQEFEQLKADIPLMFTEGAAAYLDLNKTWDKVHFIITGYDDLFVPTFLMSKNDEDNLPAINAIRGGLEIAYYTGYEFLRYLTNDEVAQVAQALANFSYAQIRKRLQLSGLKEDSYDYLFRSTYSLIKYYQDAAEKGNGMFLYLA